MADDELVYLELIEMDAVAAANNKKVSSASVRVDFNPIEAMSNDEFIKHHRLSKTLALDLCAELRPMFKEPTRATDLSVETKVMTALAFYATGSYQKPIGNMIGHSMSQSTVSRVIAEVTRCLNTELFRRKYIKFPQTHQERAATRAGFFLKFGIPGVLGCIDGTHVAIVRPKEYEERYYCRKHYHSLNVQLICDADMQITSVDAGHGGSAHDSFVWNTHPIKDHMANLPENTWLLGDSGYPLRSYLMTPIVNAMPDTPEAHYTQIHVKTRNVVERTIGLLKARFRCLLSHRVLHYSPQNAAAIVNACCILHNICIENNVPIIGEEAADAEVIEEPEPGEVGAEANAELQIGVATRQALINRLWNMRPNN